MIYNHTTVDPKAFMLNEGNERAAVIDYNPVFVLFMTRSENSNGDILSANSFVPMKYDDKFITLAPSTDVFY